MSIKEILKQLDSGILPDKFNYSITNNDNVDISKLQYNAFYRSYDFYSSKYPKGMVESLPGFDNYINYVVEKNKNKTPLQEYNEINDKNK